ncbi:LCP family protein [Catellatospora sp. NPDC049133]|jgi:LCP family protein required for cell wall assembly|uniref:LCP family protein n=1 Tax=Catellatospora sp. NPDC049133 TaxID=3155499 RepID=UPI00340222B0
MSQQTPDEPEATPQAGDAGAEDVSSTPPAKPAQRPTGRASVGRASVTPPPGGFANLPTGPYPSVGGSSGDEKNKPAARVYGRAAAGGSADGKPADDKAAGRGSAARATSGRASVPSTPAARVSSSSSRGRGNGGSARVPVSGSGNTYGSAKKKVQPKWGRIALVALIALALCGGLGLGGAWLYAKSVEGDLSRTDPFSALTGGRPPKTVNGSQNILLVGSDSRDPDAPTDQGGQWRTDTMIIMHIPSSQDRAYLISLPRDLHVYIPKDAAQADCGTRKAKLNAAYAFGGMPLLVKTVECYASVRMDHVMLIDFGGFTEVVDAIGGVDMKIEKTITSIHKPKRTFTKGTMHLNGAEALDYVRQRKQFPDGDFARMRHQQQLLKALLDKAASGGILTSPGKLNDFLGAVTSAVTVDQEFKLIDMAIQFRGIRSDDLIFLTSPHLGSQMVGGESVVVSDKPKAIALYEAVGKDQMKQWYETNVSPPPSPSVNN